MAKKKMPEPPSNGGKEGKHKFIGRSTCPHCVVQKQYAKGQVESFSVRLDQGGVGLAEDFDELDTAISKTKKAINDIKDLCDTDKIKEKKLNKRDQKEVCTDDEELLENHLQDLEFLKDIDFENVRKRFEVEYIDDVNNYKELMPKIKRMKIDSVPTVMEEGCDDKSCTKTGALDPINMVLHDAIVRKDTAKIDKIKDYLNKRRERVVNSLEKGGHKREAEKLKKAYQERNLDTVIDNWWNK